MSGRIIDDFYARDAVAAYHSDFTDMMEFLDGTMVPALPVFPMGGGVATFPEETLHLAVLDSELEVEKIFQSNLWHYSAPHGAVTHAWNLFLAYCKTHPEWSFWRDWYQGFLDGKPLDWELQKEIALIPDKEWEKGPKRIAELIDEITARFDLRARIAELEAALAAATRSRLGIGGNDPPQPIADAPPIAKEISVLWAPVQGLMAETETKTPDKRRIEQYMNALERALKTGVQWCGSKADLAVDTVIKWAIPAVGGGYFALNPDKIAAVIEAARIWLHMLF